VETQKNSSFLLKTITHWFHRNLSDPEAIALLFTLIFGFLFFEAFGRYLLPLLISVVIAYLLAPCVTLLYRYRFPHWLAVLTVYFVFSGLLICALFLVLPILWKQFAALLHELPVALNKGSAWITQFTSRYPKLFPNQQDPLVQLATYLRAQSARIGQFILSFSLATIPSLIQIIVYLVLIPLLIFFFLKDKQLIAEWIGRYLPKRRGLLHIVWKEINVQIGAYVRGRVFEILIASTTASIAFHFLNLQYAFLLGFLLGLSVIFPYIGALAMTVPITIVSLMQWGFSAHFVYVLLTFAIIIIVDGNVLMPLLFSETMSLHPVAIILAVLIFGGLWGFWGIFFSVPLTTALKTVLDHWPQTIASTLPHINSTISQTDPE
jgi:putative permease